MFSARGGEILIKIVFQVVPNYVMGILKLSVSLYNEIKSTFFHFWWGSVEGHKKISLVKWDNV